MKSSTHEIEVLMGEMTLQRKRRGLSLEGLASELNALRKTNDINPSIVCRWEHAGKSSGSYPNADRTITLIRWIQSAKKRK